MGLGRKKRTKRRQGDPEDVPMTPMIDIVFQLLVYFVFTFDPVNVFAHMDVTRPQSDSKATPDTPPPEMYEIMVRRRGPIPYGAPGSKAAYSINKSSPVDLASLEAVLSQITPDETITMLCDTEGVHEDLVSALNLCTKYGLRNVNVLSSH